MNEGDQIEAPKSIVVNVTIQHGNGCPSDFPGGILEKVVVKNMGRQGGDKVLEQRNSWLEYSLTGVFDASTGDEHQA